MMVKSTEIVTRVKITFWKLFRKLQFHNNSDDSNHFMLDQGCYQVIHYAWNVQLQNTRMNAAFWSFVLQLKKKKRRKSENCKMKISNFCKLHRQPFKCNSQVEFSFSSSLKSEINRLVKVFLFLHLFFLHFFPGFTFCQFCNFCNFVHFLTLSSF